MYQPRIGALSTQFMMLIVALLNILGEIQASVSNTNLLTFTLTPQSVTSPVTLHEPPKPVISSLSPKTIFVLNTKDNEVKKFEENATSSFIENTAGSFSYVPTSGTVSPFPFISSGTHTNYSFLSTSSTMSSSLPDTSIMTPFTPLQQFLAFGNYLVLQSSAEGYSIFNTASRISVRTETYDTTLREKSPFEI